MMRWSSTKERESMHKITSILLFVLMTTSTSFSASIFPTLRKSQQEQQQQRRRMIHPNKHCPLLPPNITRNTTNNFHHHQSQLQNRPHIIAHRGSSYHIPEHTLQSHRLALDLGADYLEVDLVPTKDGTLIAVHDVDLSTTTNVRQLFPDRGRSANDGKGRHVWEDAFFSWDFTLEEIKTLRVRQRFFMDDYSYLEEAKWHREPVRSHLLDGLLGVPTLEEVVELLYNYNTFIRPKLKLNDYTPIVNASNATNVTAEPPPLSLPLTRRPGLYLELKHPKFIQSDTKDELLDYPGIDVVEILYNTLTSNRLAEELFFDESKCEMERYDGDYHIPPLVMECFDGEVLDELRAWFVGSGYGGVGMIPPVVLLAEKEDCDKEEFWMEVDRLKPEGVGVSKDCLIEPLPSDSNNGTLSDQGDQSTSLSFMERARMYDTMAVHAFTESLRLGKVNDRFNGSEEEELRYLLCEVGVDGVFVDNVDLGFRVGIQPCPSPASEVEIDEDEDDNDENEEDQDMEEQHATILANATVESFSNTTTNVTNVTNITNNKNETKLPSITDTSTNTNTSRNKLCYSLNDDDKMIIYRTMAFAIMGFFLGSLFTFWVGQCRSSARSRRRRRLQSIGLLQSDPDDTQMT